MCNTAPGDGDPDGCWGGGFDANDVFVPLTCWNGLQPYMTGVTERDRVTKGTWNQYTCCPPEPRQKCPCIGNQGFYDSHGSHRVDGIMRPGYVYPPNLGGFCSDKEKEGVLGSGWCYVSCDTNVCKNLTRHVTTTMWAGQLFDRELCYSYQNCGNPDNIPALKEAACKQRGGSFKNGKCSCDNGGLCNDNHKQNPENNKVVCDNWCWVGPLLLTMVLALAIGALAYAHSQRKQKLKLEEIKEEPLLSNDPEKGILMGVPSFTPMTGAFVIPFAQLEVGRVIAAGAQGQIRRGIFSGKAVAIKELLSVMFDSDETDELAKEAKMLSSIQHPNIVRFYGMSVDHSPARGTSYYLVTDLKDRDLRDLLKSERTISTQEVMRIACQICEPLEFLHSVGMVHRDLKPENILLDANLTIFLCDFGISKICNRDRDCSVHMTTNMGTAAYMAPEMTSLVAYATDFPVQCDRELAFRDKVQQLGANQKIQELLLRHTAAMGQFDLSSTPSPKPSPNSASNRSNCSNNSDSSIVHTPRDLAPKVDCYSFAIVLWALLSWKGPFPDMTPVQIMVAVAVHNKRPPTTSLEQEWGKPVVDLMRQLWSADPSARPSITHAMGVLLKLLDELCKRAVHKSTKLYLV